MSDFINDIYESSLKILDKPDEIAKDFLESLYEEHIDTEDLALAEPDRQVRLENKEGRNKPRSQSELLNKSGN